MEFFVDGEIEAVLHFLKEAPVVLGMEFRVFAFECAPDGGVFHEFHQLFVLRHAELYQCQLGVCVVFLFGGSVLVGEDRLGFLCEVCHELHLLAEEFFDGRLEFVELMGGRLGGPCDDERCSGFVDEDGVDFVNDCEEVVTLDEFVLGGSHTHVPEIVEAEFGVSAVCDVALVHVTSDGWWLFVLEASDGESEPFEDVSHPFGVTFCQVVVDGDELYVSAGQSVEIERHDGDERFSFAGCHFSDVLLVQCDGADELDVEGDHVPGEDVPRDFDGRALKSSAGVLDDGIRLAQNVVGRFAVFQAVLELLCFCLEFVVRETLVLFKEFVDSGDKWGDFLECPFIVTAEDFLREPLNHDAEGKWKINELFSIACVARTRADTARRFAKELFRTRVVDGESLFAEWAVIGLERFEVELKECGHGYAEVHVACGTVHKHCDADWDCACGLDQVDGLLDASALGDHVFSDEDLFARLERESTAEQEVGVFVLFGEDGLDAQGARDFLTDDDAADGRCDDGVDFDVFPLGSEFSAESGRDEGVLENECALEVLFAVEAASELEMS